MARDPLTVLMAVRQRWVDQQRQALAACLTAESAAADRIRSIDAAMARDRDLTDQFPDHLKFRDIFLATRHHLLAERRTASAALAEAGSRSEEARRTLATARLAAEAVERLIAERRLAARAEADRRSQHELEDVARVRRS